MKNVCVAHSYWRISFFKLFLISKMSNNVKAVYYWLLLYTVHLLKKKLGLFLLIE